MISTKDFTTLVRDQVTAIQGASNRLLDLAIGSVLRAITEANASVVMWLQSLILQLLITTRASTAKGTDLDGFIADFGMEPRLGAVAATGSVTFSRFTSTLQAVIVPGVTVQTGDLSQRFAVMLNASHPAYNSVLGGYVLGAGVSSLVVPVEAVTAGSGGNAVAGSITSLASSIPGVDTITNAADFVNGSDGESDPALRLRFIAFVASLSKGTIAAVRYAAASVQAGVTVAVVENELPSGTVRYGFFYVVADDGSGAPSPTFLSTVASAVNAVRPLTSTFAVVAPTLLPANIALTIATAAGVSHPAAVALVVANISAYVNTLPLGVGLKYTKLIQLAYEASAGVTDVSGLTINSGTSNIAGGPSVAIRAGTVNVS